MDAATESYPPGPREQAPTPEPRTTAGAHQRRPIGEIFVELGFISMAQLETALAAQREAGGRIGEILVEQGSLTRLDLASALAEHWEPRKREAEPGSLSLIDTAQPASREDLTWLAEDRAAIAELELRLRIAEERLAAEPGEQQPMDRERRPRDDEHGALQAQVDEIGRRLEALEGVEAALAELRLSVERLGAMQARDALVVNTRLEAAEAALVALDDRESAAFEVGGWVAFAPAPSGYVLVELPGALPELGSTIEIEHCEGHLVVTRFGRSPLPFDGRPCAYLDRA